MLATRPVAAQAPAAAEAWRGAVTPLAAGHWAYAALDRLVAAGWIEASRVDGARPLPIGAVAAALESAARAAGDGRGAGTVRRGSTARRAVAPAVAGAADAAGDDATSRALAEFARRAWARFRREFPPTDALASAFSLGYEESVDADGRWRGVVFRPRLVWAPGAPFALHYEPELRHGAAGAGRATTDAGHGRFGFAVRWKRLWLFAGRERLAFETGASGGVTLSDRAPLDGIGIGVVDPIVVPGIGRLHGLVYLSRIGGDGYGEVAGFGAARVSLTPAPWLQLHLNRTTLVARRHGAAELTPRDVLLILVGKHTEFEDQRASVGLRLRTKLGGWALQPYLEWGFEDTAGLEEDPGIVTGIFAAAIPGWPGVSLRYEYTAFGEHALLFPGGEFLSRDWYRHLAGIRDRYVHEDGTPIGHPLGGYGYEHRVEAGMWSDDARLRVLLTAFRRRRSEGNILFDRQPGASIGGALDVRYTAAGGLDLVAAFGAELGLEGWATRRLHLGLRW
ncbi:MAG TPA: capsule assembly Wzi family protein [Longimicrobiales bacterium]